LLLDRPPPRSSLCRLRPLALPVCVACVFLARFHTSPRSSPPPFRAVFVVVVAASSVATAPNEQPSSCRPKRREEKRREEKYTCERVGVAFVFARAFPFPLRLHSTMASFLQARVFLLVALIALLVSPFFLTSTVSVGIERRAQDVEDCVACRYVWLQVEMDVGNSQIEENIYDSFTQNCIEAQKAPIFYPACQDMFDIIDDMIGDYMDGYTVNQLCENSRMCR